MRIEICGGIGSGKTTLASLFERSRIRPILESFHSNPFWEAFYSNPAKYNFETELTFLLQHYHQIKRAADEQSNFICDFSIYQDLAFARIGLRSNRLRIFEEAMFECLKEVGPPHVVICLKCPAVVLIKRIRQRGRSQENSINESFLNLLNDAIYNELASLNKTKLVYFDSGSDNFRTVSTKAILQTVLGWVDV